MSAFQAPPSITVHLQGTGAVPVGTVFGIGRNYAAHARELGNEPPPEPVVFLKAATSLLDGGGVVVLPPDSRDVQHELEIVVLLGRGGRHIPPGTAQDHIAGYGLGIDITARDWQRQAQAEGNPWAIAKGCDSFGPISPFLPAAQVADPARLGFELRVNGLLRQAGNTGDMLFGFGELVAYLSRHFSLRAGDLIFTGTPEGVSRLAPGDTLEARLLDHGLALTAQVAASA